MNTFEQAYCERHGCDAADFTREVFARSLPLHLRPAALVIRMVYPRFFDCEKTLLAGLAEAQHLDSVRFELETYLAHPINRRWLRRKGRFRVSRRRLLRLAQEYLPENKRD